MSVSAPMPIWDVSNKWGRFLEVPLSSLGFDAAFSRTDKNMSELEVMKPLKETNRGRSCQTMKELLTARCRWSRGERRKRPSEAGRVQSLSPSCHRRNHPERRHTHVGQSQGCLKLGGGGQLLRLVTMPTGGWGHLLYKARSVLLYIIPVTLDFTLCSSGLKGSYISVAAFLKVACPIADKQMDGSICVMFICWGK